MCCLVVGESQKEASVGDVALASWNPMSVEVGGCSWRGGRSKLYGYGSPLRMKVISLEGGIIDSARRLKNNSVE